MRISDWSSDVCSSDLTTDLADHDDALGLRIVLEQLKAVDEVPAVDRVAADADDGRLAQARVGRLLDRLVRQRARARDDADLAHGMDVAGHDADLALAGGDDVRDRKSPRLTSRH